MVMKAIFDSNTQFPSSPLVRSCLPDFTLVPILPFCSSASWPNIIFDYLPSFAFCETLSDIHTTLIYIANIEIYRFVNKSADNDVKCFPTKTQGGKRS